MVNEHATRDPVDYPSPNDPRDVKKPRLSEDPRQPYYPPHDNNRHPDRDYDRDRRPPLPDDRHRHPPPSDDRHNRPPAPDTRDRRPYRRDLRDELHPHIPDPVAAPITSPPSPPAPSGVRLLLANLSYTTTEEQITDFFRDHGAAVATVRLVKVSSSNRVNGNAYVWMADERSVDIALDTDQREFMGRKLRVSAMPEHQRTACVRGLRPRSTPADLHDLFRGSNILDVRCRPVKGGHPDMNTWFVDFADEPSFTRALAKDRSAPGLMICIATAQGRGSGRPPLSRDARAPLPPRDERRQTDPDRPQRPRDEPRHDDRSDSFDLSLIHI